MHYILSRLVKKGYDGLIPSAGNSTEDNPSIIRMHVFRVYILMAWLPAQVLLYQSNNPLYEYSILGLNAQYLFLYRCVQALLLFN